MEQLHTVELGLALRRELAAWGVAWRKLDEELKARGLPGMSHKLAPEELHKITLGNLNAALEIAGRDLAGFLALVAGSYAPVDVLAAELVTHRKPRWSKAQALTLERVAERAHRGTAGFPLFRAELRRIEILREDDAETAELYAWQTLEEASAAGNAGGTAAALAVLAGFYERPRAQPLFVLALKILGPGAEGIVAGKVYMSFGRFLFTNGYPRQARRLLKFQVLPELMVSGDNDEKALGLMYLARAAAMVGEMDLRLECLEQAIGFAGDRLRFHALQQLAYTQLNLAKDLETTAQLYDDLVRCGEFQKAPRKAQTRIRCSRMTARFLAGHLTAADAPEWAQIYAEVEQVFIEPERVQAATEMATFQRAVGLQAAAKETLEAVFWTAAGLEDTDSKIRNAYVAACSATWEVLEAHFAVFRGRSSPEAEKVKQETP